MSTVLSVSLDSFPPMLITCTFRPYGIGVRVRFMVMVGIWVFLWRISITTCLCQQLQLIVTTSRKQIHRQWGTNTNTNQTYWREWSSCRQNRSSETANMWGTTSHQLSYNEQSARLRLCWLCHRQEEQGLHNPRLSHSKQMSTGLLQKYN